MPFGQAVTDAVRAGSATWFEDMDYATDPAPPLAFHAGRERAGHDASRVPRTPLCAVIDEACRVLSSS